MKHYFDFNTPVCNAAVAFGRFDGMHIGHRAVVKKLASYSNSVLISFADNYGEIIYTEVEKEYVLKTQGVKNMITVKAETYENMEIAEFVKNCLKDKLSANTVVVGENYDKLDELKKGVSDFGSELKNAVDLTSVTDTEVVMVKYAPLAHNKDNDTFIFNSDDQNVEEYANKYPIACEIEKFSLESKDTYAHLEDNYIVINNEKVLPLSCIKLVGKHNIQNIMIAAMACKKLGISNEIIEDTISNFNGVEHRIEFVREINGVRYYNDSKGTNTDATITAIKSFDDNIILLVGGYEKGLSMDEMKKYMKPVKKVIGYGAAGKRIAGDLVDDPLIVTTLDEAVKQAYDMAKAGDTVLLSPTTSSYDQYKNYEERGKHFKQLVNNL